MPRSPSLFICVIFLFISLMSSLVCFASPGEPTEDEKQKAKEAFNRGRASFEQQAFREAADSFREAYDLMPSWKLLYNIGQAETAASRYGLALDSFERYLATGGDRVPEDRKEDVIKEITRLRAMVGFLEIKAPDGSTVFIDNVKRGKAPLPGRIKVTAGIEHKVFVEMGSDSIFTRAVIVSGGETIVVNAGRSEKEGPQEPAPVAEPVQQEAAPKVEKKEISPLVTSGWILAGTGAAIAISGAVAGGIAVKKSNALKSDCNTESGTCPFGYDDKISSLKTTSLVSSILLPVGGAIAASGAVLLILGYRKDEKATDDKSSEVTFVPVTAPGYGGLQVQGRF